MSCSRWVSLDMAHVVKSSKWFTQRPILLWLLRYCCENYDAVISLLQMMWAACISFTSGTEWSFTLHLSLKLIVRDYNLEFISCLVSYFLCNSWNLQTFLQCLVCFQTAWFLKLLHFDPVQIVFIAGWNFAISFLFRPNLSLLSQVVIYTRKKAPIIIHALINYNY